MVREDFHGVISGESPLRVVANPKPHDLSSSMDMYDQRKTVNLASGLLSDPEDVTGGSTMVVQYAPRVPLDSKS